MIIGFWSFLDGGFDILKVSLFCGMFCAAGWARGGGVGSWMGYCGRGKDRGERGGGSGWGTMLAEAEAGG